MIAEFLLSQKLLEKMFGFGLGMNLINFGCLAFGQKMRKNVCVNHFEISRTLVKLKLPNQINFTNYQSIRFNIHLKKNFNLYYLKSN